MVSVVFIGKRDQNIFVEPSEGIFGRCEPGLFEQMTCGTDYTPQNQPNVPPDMIHT